MYEKIEFSFILKMYGSTQTFAMFHYVVIKCIMFKVSFESSFYSFSFLLLMENVYFLGLVIMNFIFSWIINAEYLEFQFYMPILKL
jgi:hypothetical protein